MAITIKPNPDVTMMADELKAVRTAALGSYFVKKEREALLPHPSSSDKDPTRYATYLANADFDDFTGVTLTSLLDRMNIQDTEIVMPEKLEYLREDADGDGLSLKGMVATSSENILQAGFHILLTDYQGFSDLPSSELSISDIKKLNARATIKQYTRESVVDWDFARINGAMQLTYILLKEVSSELDKSTMERKEVTVYIKLAIDDTGYYQQKYIDHPDNDEIEEGEIFHIEAGGSVLQFIPIEIVADTELQGGVMPLKCGHLSSIANVAYSRYHTSAKLKEVLNALVPALFVYGMDDGAFEMFEKVNGRKSIAMGAFTPNMMPLDSGQMSVEIISAKDNTLAFEREMQTQAKNARAVGAVFDTDGSGTRTATEFIAQASTSSAILTPLSNSVESALERCIVYAGMFEGLWPADNLSDGFGEVIVDMPSDFGASKITAIEAKEYREAYMANAITLATYLKALKLGGWEVGDIEQEMADISNQAPSIV